MWFLKRNKNNTNEIDRAAAEAEAVADLRFVRAVREAAADEIVGRFPANREVDTTAAETAAIEEAVRVFGPLNHLHTAVTRCGRWPEELDSPYGYLASMVDASRRTKVTVTGVAGNGIVAASVIISSETIRPSLRQVAEEVLLNHQHTTVEEARTTIRSYLEALADTRPDMGSFAQHDLAPTVEFFPAGQITRISSHGGASNAFAYVGGERYPVSFQAAHKLTALVGSELT